MFVQIVLCHRKTVIKAQKTSKAAAPCASSATLQRPLGNRKSELQNTGSAEGEVIPGGTPRDGAEYHPACLGLLSLAKRYGKPRLEAAYVLALQIGACQYRHVRDILANNRDRSTQSRAGEWVSPDHVHVRGPSYYQ